MYLLSRFLLILTSANLVDMGYAALFFNRTNFSGVIDAGPVGGMTQSSAYAIDYRFSEPPRGLPRRGSLDLPYYV